MATAGPVKGARFYRRWSSRAAQVALTASDTKLRTRCAHSANMWARIADAIDAGDQDSLVQLTHNLAFIAPEPAKA
jgi:hypothetical protein